MENMDPHEGKMEIQLRQWGMKLDELVAKAEETGTTTYRRNLDLLKAKYKVAQSKLEEFKTAGSENQATCKAGLESAWNELKITFKKLAN